MNRLIATIATDMFEVTTNTPLTDEQIIAAALGIEAPAVVQRALGDG
jgi:hypothetical protein